jgi:hypothetical protein
MGITAGGWIAIGIATAGTAVSIQQNKQSQKETKKANKAAQRQSQAEAARSRKQQIRQARIKRGQLESVGALTGTQGSSSQVGAAGSIQTQLGSNLSFLNTSVANQNSMFKHNQKAADFSGNANAAQGVASLASSFSGSFGGAPDGGDTT